MMLAFFSEKPFFFPGKHGYPRPTPTEVWAQTIWIPFIVIPGQNTQHSKIFIPANPHQWVATHSPFHVTIICSFLF